MNDAYNGFGDSLCMFMFGSEHMMVTVSFIMSIRKMALKAQVAIE